MPSNSNSKPRFYFYRSLFGYLTALMFALCAGSFWMVMALLTQTEANWMVIPSALIGIWISGWIPRTSALMQSLCAFTFTLIAISYAHFLMASAIISSSLGLNLFVALRHIGTDMAWAISSSRMTRNHFVFFFCVLCLTAASRYFLSSSQKRIRQIKP
jgi:hypothetical protein